MIIMIGADKFCIINNNHLLKLNFTPFPNLETPRLVLRQIKLEDENEIYILRSDSRVNEFLEREKAGSIEDARNFINMINANIRNNKAVMWAITMKNNSKLIGTIVYWNISKENSTAEIGYELNPDFQGKGIMQEAISKIIEFGFETMEIQTIEAYTTDGNHKSINLLVKNNFMIKPHAEKKDELKNTVIYTLTKSKKVVSCE
jgi:ribosomal-protein-alanine N-acetyltransferase